MIGLSMPYYLYSSWTFPPIFFHLQPSSVLFKVAPISEHYYILTVDEEDSHIKIDVNSSRRNLDILLSDLDNNIAELAHDLSFPLFFFYFIVLYSDLGLELGKGACGFGVFLFRFATEFYTWRHFFNSNTYKDTQHLINNVHLK